MSVRVMVRMSKIMRTPIKRGVRTYATIVQPCLGIYIENLKNYLPICVRIRTTSANSLERTRNRHACKF